MDLPLTADLSERADDAASNGEGVLSFEEVYNRHYRFVWSVLRAFGVPPGTVEDVAQDVFVVVHRRLPDFEGRSNVRTWLFRIASWVVARERRRFRTRRPHESIGDDDVRDGGPSPFETTASRQALRTVERILNRMDEEKRVVFVLMDIEGMKAHEVAELFPMNVQTIYSRLRIAREQFRRLLEASSEQLEGNER